jgi:hypothetical protein
MKKDYVFHFMITKDGDPTEQNIADSLQAAYTNVQNNEIYFAMEPKLHKGVILISVVGFISELKSFEGHVGEELKNHSCLLKKIGQNIYKKGKK